MSTSSARGPDRSGFVVEAALVGEHRVAARADLARLGLERAQLRELRFELGPFGQRGPPVAQPVPRGVVLLDEQERFELFGTHGQGPVVGVGGWVRRRGGVVGGDVCGAP